jgi:hypothetical protein
MESKSFFSFSSVVEVKGSHAIYVSQPEAVAALIKQAAESLETAAAATRGFPLNTSACFHSGRSARTSRKRC